MIPELFLVLIVAVIVLGPKQLPMVARQLGRFIANINRFCQKYKNEFDQMIRFAELKNNIARAEQAELKATKENNRNSSRSSEFSENS